MILHSKHFWAKVRNWFSDFAPPAWDRIVLPVTASLKPFIPGFLPCFTFGDAVPVQSFIRLAFLATCHKYVTPAVTIFNELKQHVHDSEWVFGISDGSFDRSFRINVAHAMYLAALSQFRATEVCLCTA